MPIFMPGTEFETSLPMYEWSKTMNASGIITTNFVEQSPSKETNRHSANQQMSRLLLLSVGNIVELSL
jgi:hypothetical protein